MLFLRFYANQMTTTTRIQRLLNAYLLACCPQPKPRGTSVDVAADHTTITSVLICRLSAVHRGDQPSLCVCVCACQCCVLATFVVAYSFIYCGCVHIQC